VTTTLGVESLVPADLFHGNLPASDPVVFPEEVLPARPPASGGFFLENEMMPGVILSLCKAGGWATPVEYSAFSSLSLKSRNSRKRLTFLNGKAQVIFSDIL